jgi:GNAT superfamily N-acetyltransferase
MTPTITVRECAPRDVNALVRMCDALNAHSGLPTGRLRAAEYRAALFGKNAFLFADLAAEGEARHIGYALSHDAFTTDYGERGMYVVDLYVDPEWRRAGVGRRLMEAAAARARKRGGSHLWWASMPGNYRARRFYSAIGATDERLHSHAVFGKAFEKLALKGERRRPRATGLPASKIIGQE